MLFRRILESFSKVILQKTGMLKLIRFSCQFMQTPQNLPRVSFGILTSCWLFLATIIFIDLKQRPKREEKVSFFRKLMVPLEFFLLPVVTFIFTALPGIDAHTRLMLGKYLEYRVTEKV